MMTLIRQIAKVVHPILGLAGLALVLGLTGCGGGGTGGTGQTSQPPGAVTISVSPGSVTINSGVATNFAVTGGTGPYTVTSNNLTVIPVNGLVSQNGAFSITANAVATD